MSVPNSLTAEELRVLACLVEKSYTTPDQYPLSTNALTTACNQKTSRDPVVDYSPHLVDQTLQLLRDAGWVRMIRATGSRAFKHRHVIDEKLGLTEPQQAVLAVLALRGPQSPGELRTRTERYHRFDDLESVERVLDDLSSRAEPLTRNLGRGPGQSQDRWIQLLGPETVDVSEHRSGDQHRADNNHRAPTTTPPDAAPSGSSMRAGESNEGRVGVLEDRIAALEHRLEVLERELGIDG